MTVDIKQYQEEIKQLQQEVAELKGIVAEAGTQAEQSLAGWQRAQADYANLKKENEKRGQEVVEFANAAFMSELLPVYNHFKLALSHIPEDQQDRDWVVGIKHIQKQFQDFLKKYQIVEIKTVGEKFNPEMHEAITYESQEGFESDIIFAEAQPGYTLNGKVINPAKVKVAK